MKRRKERPTCTREPSGLAPFPHSITLWEVFFPAGSTMEDGHRWLKDHGYPNYDPYKGPWLGVTFENGISRVHLFHHERLHVPDFQI